MAESCEHVNFDFGIQTISGYVMCTDCGKSVPFEHALKMLDELISEQADAIAELRYQVRIVSNDLEALKHARSK